MLMRRVPSKRENFFTEFSLVISSPCIHQQSIVWKVGEFEITVFNTLNKCEQINGHRTDCVSDYVSAKVSSKNPLVQAGSITPPAVLAKENQYILFGFANKDLLSVRFGWSA